MIRLPEDHSLMNRREQNNQINSLPHSWLRGMLTRLNFRSRWVEYTRIRVAIQHSEKCTGFEPDSLRFRTLLSLISLDLSLLISKLGKVLPPLKASGKDLFSSQIFAEHFLCAFGIHHWKKQINIPANIWLIFYQLMLMDVKHLACHLVIHK